MNKTFKVIFNRATQTWVAVSELAKGHCKSSSNNVLEMSEVNKESRNFSTFKKIALASAIMMALSPNAFAVKSSTVQWTAGQGTAIAGGEARGDSNSIAIGREGPGHPGARSIGGGAIAIGGNSLAGGNLGIAIGFASKGHGKNAVAIGGHSEAVGEGAAALGGYSRAMVNSVAVGKEAEAIAENSTVIGANSSVVNANNVQTVVVGSNAFVDGAKSVVVGDSASASAIYSTVMGFNASTHSKGSTAIGTNATTADGADEAIALGTDSQAGGPRSIAIGNVADAQDESSITLGDNTRATGYGSMAFGKGAATEAGHSLAQGVEAHTEAEYAIAIGNKATVARGDSEYAIVVGTKSTVKGQDSVLIGSNSGIEYTRGTALGSNIAVQSIGGTAIGEGAKVGMGADNAVALGAGSEVGHVLPVPDLSFKNDKGTTVGVTTIAGRAPDSALSIGNSTHKRQIVNVAAGRVTASSTDAVNGSQLYAVMSHVGFNLKENRNIKARVNNDSTVTIMDTDYIKTNIFSGNRESIIKINAQTQDISVDNSGKASTARGAKVGLTNTTTVVATINKALDNSGFLLKANTDKGEKITRAGHIGINQDKNIIVERKGSDITIKTKDEVAFTKVKSATVDADLVTTKNLTVTGTSNLATVNINKTLSANEDVNLGGAGKTVSFATGATINANKNKITNIADGVNKNDAVNKGQLDKVSNVANDAKNTADTAKNTADTAKNAADLAKNAADTAKDRADIAKNTADIAKNTADTAKDTADIAKNTSDTAKGTADTALDTVNKGWNILAEKGDGNVAGGKAEKVEMGNTIKVIAGKNLNITQNGKALTFALNDSPTFDAITTGDANLGGAGKNFTVKNGTDINMGNNVVKNVADGVNANDAVNKGQLDKVNTVATDAKNTADTAKDTADLAKDTADTAKDTADLAKDTANTAKDTADLAKDTADTAKDTADAAKDTADVAKDTADTAKDTADLAKNTADTAKGTADTALDTVNKGWNILAEKGDGNVTGGKAEKVEMGNTVKVVAGKNLNITQNGKSLTFALNDSPTFDAITTGDANIGGAGKNFTVKTGTTISMGNNVVKNVADGVDANDAVNKGQLDKVSNAATDAKNIADTAKDTADLAKGTADTAKDTADLAKGTADTAKDIADLAKDTADTAKDTADTAKDIADAAKDTADIAKDTADTAKDTADTAKDTADTAKDTADLAKNTADTAKGTADTALDTVNKGWTILAEKGDGNVAGGKAEKVEMGNTIKVVAGKNLNITQNGKNLTFALNDSPTFDAITTTGGATIGGDLSVAGTSNLGSVTLKAGSTFNAGGNRLTNLAKATKGNDATTLDQVQGLIKDATTKATNINSNNLKTTNGDITHLKSDDVVVKDKLESKGNTILSGDTTIGGAGKNLTVNKGTTINMGDNIVKGVKDGVAPTDAVNKGQLDKVAKNPLTFVGNTGQTDRKLGQTLNIKGDGTTAGAYSAKNVKTKVTADKVEIQIAENPEFNTLSTKGAADIGGNLKVKGTTNTKDLTVTNNANIEKNLTVKGDSTVKGNATFEKDVKVAGKTTTKDLTVTNNANIEKNLTVKGDSTVKGNGTFEKNVTVAGKTTTKDLTVTNNANIEKNLTVKGDSTVKGNGTFEKNVTVAGKTTTKDLTVTNNANIEKNLTVKGDSTFGGQGKTFTVSKGTKVDMGGNVITNIGEGKVAAGSKEAVTGGQLHKAIQNFNTLTDKGLNFVGNNAAVINRKFGQTLKIQGSLSANKEADSSNIRTVSNAATGAIEILMAKDPTFRKLTVKDNATFEKDVKVAGKTTTKDLTVTNNANIEKNLTVKGDSAVKGNATFEKDVKVAGKTTTKDLTVTNNANIEKNLTVKGDSTVKGNATFEKNVKVAGKTTTKDLTVTNNANIDKNLTVKGDSTVKGNATFEKDVKVAGKTTTKDLTVTNNANIDKNLTVKGDSTVKGNATFEKDVKVVGKTTTKDLTVTNNANIEKNLTVKGDSTVKGNGTFEKNVTVAGKTTTKDLTVTNNANIEKNLTVKGDSTFGGQGKTFTVSKGTKVDMGGNVITNIGEGKVAAGSKEAVTGGQLHKAIQNFNTLTDKGLNFVGNNAAVINRKFGQTLKIQGSLSANKEADSSNIRTVSNAVTGTIEILMAKDPTFRKLTVKDNATFEKDVKVAGKTTTKDLTVTNNANIEKNLTVKGDSTVEGTTTTKDLTVTNNATIEKDLTVKGDSTVEGTTTTKDLSVTNNATIEKDLTVNGDSNTKGNSTIGGNLTVEKDLRVEGKTVLDELRVNQSLTLADDARIDLGRSDITGTFDIYGDTDKKTLSQALTQLQMEGPLVYVDPESGKDVQHRTDVVRLNSGSDKPVRVTNVADPKEANDAVNLGYFNQKLSLNMGQVNNRINRVDRRLRSGIASAVAMALLPQAYRAGDRIVSLGGGTYRGASAIAVGYSRVSDNGRLIIKIGGSANNAGDYAGGAAIGWKF